jgi:hypothetical protein
VSFVTLKINYSNVWFPPDYNPEGEKGFAYWFWAVNPRKT